MSAAGAARAAVPADRMALPEDVRTMPQALSFWADATPDAPALVTPGAPPVTFGALRRRAAALGDALNAAGLGRRDRVILLLPDGPACAATLLGTISAAVAVPLADGIAPAELDAAVHGLGAAAAIIDPGLAAPLRDVLDRHRIAPFTLSADDGERPLAPANHRLGPPTAHEPARPGDVAAVTLTSGTTGRPKRVPKTHGSAVNSSVTHCQDYGLDRRDRMLSVAPIPFSLGQWALYHAVCAGSATIFPPSSSLDSIWEAMAAEHPAWFEAPAGFLELLVRFLRDHPSLPAPGSLRLVRVTSAAISPEVCRELEGRIGAPILPSYSSSEAGRIATTLLPPAPSRPGSVGRLAQDVRFVDENGNDRPPGAEGEILVRGAKVFAGYLDDPDLNAAAFTPDGWFRTGDVGYLDADGFLFLTGRVNELINRGGAKVAPAEIDALLLAHPAVSEAAAFAVPDDRLGQDVVAAVVPRASHAPATWELRQWLLERLSPHKVPRRIWFVDHLPRTPNGKVQRAVLADRYQNR